MFESKEALLLPNAKARFQTIKTEADFIRAIVFGTIASLYEFSLKTPNTITKKDTDKLDLQLYVFSKTIGLAYEYSTSAGKVVVAEEDVLNMTIWLLVSQRDGEKLNIIDTGKQQIHQLLRDLENFTRHKMLLVQRGTNQIIDGSRVLDIAQQREHTIISLYTTFTYIIENWDKLAAQMLEPDSARFICAINKLEKKDVDFIEKQQDKDQVVRLQLELLNIFKKEQRILTDAATFYAELVNIKVVHVASCYKKLHDGYRNRKTRTEEQVSVLEAAAGIHCADLQEKLQTSADVEPEPLATLEARANLEYHLESVRELYCTILLTSLPLIPEKSQKKYIDDALSHGESQINRLSDFLDSSDSSSLPELKTEVLSWDKEADKLETQQLIYQLILEVEDLQRPREALEEFLKDPANMTKSKAIFLIELIKASGDYRFYVGRRMYNSSKETINLAKQKKLLFDCIPYLAMSKDKEALHICAKAYGKMINILKSELKKKDQTPLNNPLITAYSLYRHCDKTDSREYKKILKEMKRLQIVCTEELCETTFNEFLQKATNGTLLNPFTQKMNAKEALSFQTGEEEMLPDSLQDSGKDSISPLGENSNLNPEHKEESPLKEYTIFHCRPMPSQNFPEIKLDKEISDLFTTGSHAENQQAREQLSKYCFDSTGKAHIWTRLKQGAPVPDAVLLSLTGLANVGPLIRDFILYMKCSKQLSVNTATLSEQNTLATSGIMKQMSGSFKDYRRATGFFTSKKPDDPEAIAAVQRRRPKTVLEAENQSFQDTMAELDRTYTLPSLDCANLPASV